MKRKNATRSALFTSIISLLLCVSMLVGTTFAWFTDSVVSGINTIAAGNLDVELYHGKDKNPVDKVDSETLLFTDAGGNVIDQWEPGVVAFTNLKVANEGTLALKYQLSINSTEVNYYTDAQGVQHTLAEALSVAVVTDGVSGNRAAVIEAGAKAGWEGLESFELNGVLEADKKSETYGIVIYWQPGDNEADNLFNMNNGKETNDKQPLRITLGANLFATQEMYEDDSFGDDYDEDADLVAADTWDGTADTSWYNSADTEFLITTAEQMAGLAELVSGDVTFAGKTLKLGKNFDLYCEDTSPSADGDPVTFRPIGDHSKNGTFEGTFDGNGYTISNLYQNGWDLGYEWGVYGSYGLFGNINDATIKNLTITGSESYIEGGDTSFVAGSATGTCVFENITITDSVSATYNNGNGGIIGWSGAGNYTFKNITIAEDTVLAGLWGSFDSSIGGIVGQAEPGATYNFEDVDVKCRLDVYNDCTASYDYYNYRMCGMLIGRLEETTTIDGANYPDTSKYNITCNNVTVTYGDWANYHYCRANGARGIRVEAGYSYGGIPADYDHSVCTVHERELIAFDQIFGGDQYAVKGLKSYDGVNVIYNNK